MKRLHRRDLFCWSAFNETLNIDFNSFAWIREGGNVLFDPLPLSPHDLAHLRKLGGAAWIVLTNSNHLRASREVARELGARIAGPVAEKDRFPVPCDQWLDEGDEPFPGLRVIKMEGSKTPGELALLLDETALVTGDLIRAHRAGSLMMLQPEQGLQDRAAALASIRRTVQLERIEAILVGDGWCLFQDGRKHLERLVEMLSREDGRSTPRSSSSSAPA
jgi:hypothetical protein